MSSTSSIPVPAQSTLIVIDVQERLLPVMQEADLLITNIQKLLDGATILGVNTILTEQYPKGLGPTTTKLNIIQSTPILQKDSFSCLAQPVFKEILGNNPDQHLIICGIESHICVLKTALEAKEQGYTVHVVADAVSSRTVENKSLALERMRQSGIFITSVEMILFMLMECAGTDQFKSISKLIK